MQSQEEQMREARARAKRRHDEMMASSSSSTTSSSTTSTLSKVAPQKSMRVMTMSDLITKASDAATSSPTAATSEGHRHHHVEATSFVLGSSDAGAGAGTGAGAGAGAGSEETATTTAETRPRVRVRPQPQPQSQPQPQVRQQTHWASTSAIDRFIEREHLGKTATTQSDDGAGVNGIGSNSWKEAIEALRQPISPASTLPDGILPHDTVTVFGHQVHRILYRVEQRHGHSGSHGGSHGGSHSNKGPDASVFYETIALVSADLSALLGFRRVEEMRSILTSAGRSGHAASSSAASSAASSTATSDSKVQIDPRVFSTLQHCGLVPPRVHETRRSAETPDVSKLLTPLDLGLAFLALRHYAIITLQRIPAPK